MRNHYLLIPSILFFAGSINAQSYKTTFTFQKNNYGAAAVQVPFEDDVVTEAVKDYMKSKGYKDAHYKDFIIFRSVPLEEGSTTYSDAYFNIDKKSRSEKDITIVTLIPVKKEATLSPASEEDSSYVSKSMVFLDSMVSQIRRYSLSQQIQIQQKALDKIGDKLTSLKNDSGDIAKKIRSYEGDLAQNKIDQTNQTTVINNTATGDQNALAKAHKKMDKLLDNQADYEKKIRNYKADLDDNARDRATQQSLYDKQAQALDALKQRLETKAK